MHPKSVNVSVSDREHVMCLLLSHSRPANVNTSSLIYYASRNFVAPCLKLNASNCVSCDNHSERAGGILVEPVFGIFMLYSVVLTSAHIVVKVLQTFSWLIVKFKWKTGSSRKAVCLCLTLSVFISL